jgi:hypothetical protein
MPEIPMATHKRTNGLTDEDASWSHKVTRVYSPSVHGLPVGRRSVNHKPTTRG